MRGTQSFVGVMSAVWQRPSLTGLEIGWRWGVGVLALGAAWGAFRSLGAQFSIDMAAFQRVTVFQPVAAIESLGAAKDAVEGLALPILRWLVPLACMVWLIAAAVGRSVVLRRLDPAPKRRGWALFLLNGVRAALLAGVWGVWFWGIGWASHFSITGPAARSEEPSLVVFCALVICGTLALYVLWAISSWPLQLAPLLALREDLGLGASLRAALGAGPMRGKLIEVNLVMHIVRIALIVLAMVFSASPLPFSSVATQTFLACWWTGVILLYLAASDYFHVVRAAAYLAMMRLYGSGPGGWAGPGAASTGSDLH